MSTPLEQVEAEALELSVRERAQLVQRLIASLDEDAGEDPVEVERAWEAEIHRRLQEYRAGTTETIPSTDVFTEARARLRR
jgi:putative addiction module component (TIGR02574 family)